jgi:DNA polymerase-3 subunit gamma/tau
MAAGVAPAMPALARSSAPARGGTIDGPQAVAAWTLSVDQWAATVATLGLGGLARQLAAHCALLGQDGAVVRLALDPRHQHVRTPAAVERLAQSLSRHLGTSVRVEVEIVEPPAETPAGAEERQAQENLVAARESLEADPTVRALKEKFGATLRPETVRPHR